MRTKPLPIGIALATLLTGGVAFAQSGAGELPSLLCASTKVVECRSAGECREVDAAAVDVPSFLRVDFAEKTVSDPRGDDDDVSTIDLLHLVDGQIVLHGTDPGGPGRRDGTGWTATISEATGEMLVSALGPAAAFIVIGSCLVEK